MTGRQEELAIRLMKAGADVSGDEGISIFVEGMASRYMGLASLLIQKGVDINGGRTSHGRAKTPLMAAICRKDVDMGKKMIELGANVDRTALCNIRTTTTPIGLALQLDCPDIVQLLSLHGATMSASELARPENLLPKLFRRGSSAVETLKTLTCVGFDLKGMYTQRSCLYGESRACREAPPRWSNCQSASDGQS